MSTSNGARPAESIAVIGLGNPLMGDDGIGLAVLERLRREWLFDPCVVLVDGGTWGLQLLPIVEAADRVLIIDAIRADRAPGSLVMLVGDDVPRRLHVKLSPHQVEIREVLALAQFRGTLPRDVVALGVEPDAVELREGLSPTVERAMDQLVSLAVDRLLAWGVTCSLRPEEALTCTR